MLFIGYFSCLIVAFTALALWLVGSFNHSTLEKHYHPRPAVAQADEIAPLHLEVTKEPAKEDVSPVKHHKPKLLARQRNDYEGRGYGNGLGYAEEQNGPMRLLSNW